MLDAADLFLFALCFQGGIEGPPTQGQSYTRTIVRTFLLLLSIRHLVRDDSPKPTVGASKDIIRSCMHELPVGGSKGRRCDRVE